ncbi:MAG: sugar phosphate isomerase/epimerase [Ruminococcaceae bacterium]|nr:sugar phosphate isomerase/epimerase [Oscillospiraceae bacterium]
MLLGLACNSFGDSGFAKYWGENSFKKMREFGFSAVDFGIPGKFYTSFYKSDAETRKKFLLHEKALVEEAELYIHQAHAPCLSLSRPLSEEERVGIINDIKVSIESCPILGCEFLVVHPFMPNGWEGRGKPMAEDNFNKNVEYLRSLSDYAKEHGVTLCLENMPCLGFSISTPEEILEVVKAVDRENVKMCFDTGHVTAFSRFMKVGDEIRKCGDAIKVLHIHDNYGGADQHIFPGLGMTDWTDVMAALKEINFDGVFSLELNFPDKFSESIFENFCRLVSKMTHDIVNGLLQ